MKKIELYSNYFEIKMKQDILKYNLVVEGGNVTECMQEIRQTMFSNKENLKLIY